MSHIPSKQSSDGLPTGPWVEQALRQIIGLSLTAWHDGAMQTDHSVSGSAGQNRTSPEPLITILRDSVFVTIKPLLYRPNSSENIEPVHELFHENVFSQRISSP